jgi:parallel beta-helix repeat protein
MIRHGDSPRALIWTPPPRWQSDRLMPNSENWCEDSLVLRTSTEAGASRVQPRTPGSPHSPIYIWGDSDFASQALTEGWPGNGTAVNPYIIDGLDIDATNTSTCIVIYQTTVHFSIRYCSLQGAFWGWDGAIVLDNVSHGYLLNNTCTGGLDGISIWSCTLITAANNSLSYNAYSGIYVQDTTLTTLFNNTCFANSYFDIQLLYSRQNTVVNNTCSSVLGNIALIGSGDNILANNSMTGGGLLLSGYSPFEGRQTLVMGNTVNAKPLLFWQDQVGGTLPSGFGQAVLVNCSQTTVRDATVTGCYAGVTLCGCTEITVANLLCSDNQYGLVLYDCNETLVTNNAFFNIGYASISIQNCSSNNVVANNTCIGNAPYSCCIELFATGNILWNNTCMDSPLGILVVAGSSNTIGGSWIANDSIGMQLFPEAGGNLIEANIFTANGQDAIDDSDTGNTFDWNYWSSYYGRDWDGNGIGDSPYLVPGIAHARDYRPLMLLPGSPVTWLEYPTDQYFPYGSYIWYGLDATATPPGVTQWWLSDATLFAIDQYGVLTNLVTLPVGTYWVQVWVSDWMGNVITASFRVIVYEWSTTTTTILQIPIIIFIIGTVATISTAAFVSIVGIVILRQRRPTGPPPTEPFGDTRPPIDQWNARCPLCGSHLFGDEGYCPGCGNRVTKSRGG